MDIIFGNRLKYLISISHRSRTRICSDLAISPSTLNGYITGRRTPNLQMLVQFSKYFDVSCDYLLGVSDEMH